MDPYAADLVPIARAFGFEAPEVTRATNPYKLTLCHARNGDRIPARRAALWIRPRLARRSVKIDVDSEKPQLTTKRIS
jgi:hypothetical protein